MKVELELTENQLKDLDKGLEDLLKNLTDEQKTELIKGYMERTLDKICYEENTSYYSSSYKQLSSFGKEVVEGLQAKVKEHITNKVLQNEVIQETVNDVVKNIKNDLANIVRKSICSFITEHLFQSREQINQDLDYAIQRYMCDHNPNNFR